MIFEKGERVEVGKLAFFGRGAISEQICCLVNEEILGFYDDENGFEIDKDIPVIYAVGYKDLNNKKRRLEKLITDGYRVCSYIANNAIVSRKVNIENGVIINQGVIVDNYVDLKKGCFINIGTTISHHTLIGECVFLAPGVTIAGNVTVEDNVFIGANATVINDITIGQGSVVAAGAVVTSNVAPYTLVAGVPAMKKKDITFSS